KPGSNVAKAAVKVLTEGLAHELREARAPITAQLFVPGFTYTGMIQRFAPTKPDSAWTSEQTVDYFIERMAKGDFYILCPDNDVSSQRDRKRVEWAIGDIIENRPALSRWHPDYAEKFAAHEAEAMNQS
ncbi:MAG: short-chain dehydrogenase, partial [Shimia sp.]|nr:short-chain dehydrogenase [Shimia sp.]